MADLSACNLIDGDYRQIVAATRDFFAERKVPFYHSRQHTGSLRHLVVRKGSATGELLLNLVTTSQMELPVEEWAKALLALPLAGHIVGILHTVNDGVADVALGSESRVLFGRDYLVEKLLGLSFRVTATSFFQTNTSGAEVLYQTVRVYAGAENGRVIYDLYCGTGTIGQLLAQNAKKVYGVELWEAAVADANRNAEQNGITNAEFVAGDVLKMLDTLPEKPDLAVIDPPREGLVPKALQKLAAMGIPRFVYVSCKPTSLARDLAAFREAGYHTERVKIVNQFPRTQHVETVCLLIKEN